MVERFGPSFRPCLPERYTAIAADHLASQVVMIVSGAITGSCEACGVGRAADAAVAFGFGGAILWQRPYVRALRLPLTALSQGALLVACILLSSGYFSAECKTSTESTLPGHSAAGALLSVSACLALLAVLLDCSAMAKGMLQGRRRRLCEEVGEMRGKAAGEKVSYDDLVDVVRQCWGVEAQEDEGLRTLFAELDTKGSGTILLRDFLMKSHKVAHLRHAPTPPPKRSTSASPLAPPPALSPIADIDLLADQAPPSPHRIASRRPNSFSPKPCSMEMVDELVLLNTVNTVGRSPSHLDSHSSHLGRSPSHSHKMSGVGVLSTRTSGSTSLRTSISNSLRTSATRRSPSSREVSALHPSPRRRGETPRNSTSFQSVSSVRLPPPRRRRAPPADRLQMAR
eukprot:Hpha_TRINITY_DN8678_c0_g2::TRINITY_DN8678_c0_g2_i1::g.168913::m.168913